MCIIACKKIGVKPPTDETIKIMFEENPDGAGFMYNINNTVKIEKGFMTLKGLMSRLDSLSKEIDIESTAIVYHFRIGTHGKTIPENTHPFPLTDNIKLMQKLTCTTKLGIAHNGIFSITPREHISDTMEYIASVMYPLSKELRYFYKSKPVGKLFSAASNNSRLAFLSPNGVISYIGNFENNKDIFYSNSGYEKYGRYLTSYYKRGWYDDNYYDEIVELSWLDSKKCCVIVDGKEKSAKGYLTDDEGTIYVYVVSKDKAKILHNAYAISLFTDEVEYNYFEEENASFFNVL